MTDAKEFKRLGVLTLWATRVAGIGVTTPLADELATVAAFPENWAERVDSPLLAAWEPTINYLLHQIRFGVSAVTAVDQLPEELAHARSDLPTPTLPTPTTSPDEQPVSAETPAEITASAGTTTEPGESQPPRSTQIVEALMQWRAQRISEGADGADLIRDVTLKNLVKWGYTDAEQIGKKLAGPAAYLGREIAAVIAQFAEISSLPTVPANAAASQSAAPGTPPKESESRHRAVTNPRRQEPTEGVVLNLTHRDFCEYEYGESEIPVGPITIRGTADGVRLTFEPFIPEAGKLVFYRVVSGDDSTPFKPEAGDPVAVTTALVVHDNRYLTCAVRNYQVWCHVGVDDEDARHNQPFLIAEGQEVSPVDDFHVSEDEGRVIGRWTTYPGTQSVRIFRIPLEGSAPAREDPRNQIGVGLTNLTGFVDNDAKRGMRYLYRALAVVTVGSSQRLSRPRQQEILVSVVLGDVDDMEVTIAQDNSRFDLAWTTPEVGQVRVYRCSAPPPPGLRGSEMPEAALQVQGFDDEALIKDPVVAGDGNRSRIVSVPWPAAWDRAYLTPVTVLGGNARIGATKIQTRPLPPVSDAEIIERFDTEIITFGWPTGAAAVLAYVGSTTLSPEEICDRSRPMAEMSSAKYRRDGGLILARPLEPKGCTVCLVPVAFSRGEQIRGQVTALRYPGLHRLRYGLAQLDDASPNIRMLWLKSDLDIESPLTLVMVNRVDRLPLGPDDGDFVYFIPPHRGEPTPQCLIEAMPRGERATGWRVDWSRRRGYFRLFIARAADPARRYALADPPVRSLWFESPSGAAQ